MTAFLSGPRASAQVWKQKPHLMLRTWYVWQSLYIVVGDVVGVEDAAADIVPVLYLWVMTWKVEIIN